MRSNLAYDMKSFTETKTVEEEMEGEMEGEMGKGRRKGNIRKDGNGTQNI